MLVPHVVLTLLFIRHLMSSTSYTMLLPPYLHAPS